MAWIKRNWSKREVMDFHQPVKRPTKNSVLYHLFPSPLYAAMVEDFDEIQEECDRAVKNSKFDYNPNFGMTHKLSSPNFKTNILADNNMQALSKQIGIHIEGFLQAIEFTESGYYDPNDPLTYKVVSSWMTKFDKRDYAHIHNHGHCDISGVYYYKVGDPGTGDLFFQSPSPSQVTSFTYNHYAYKQCQIPQEGKLLLFPAYLDHGVSTNESDHDRMSLSFNILFDNR
tara:strand:+ start:1305 stop:1988 length:684 start_codon:yes stop_codon:yes gene_type:complete